MSERIKNVVASVCVPTYDRPELLRRCIERIDMQAAFPQAFEVVVVDNSEDRSAIVTVQTLCATSRHPIRYVSEPTHNISLARNRAVAVSRGAYVAFVDDDELPGKDWLGTLLETLNSFQADGVLGPVEPEFEVVPPRWLIESGLSVRERFSTGTALTAPLFMRTGNVLFRREVFDAMTSPFDPRFGRSGGEDSAFFEQALKRGFRFVWCDEAPVFEWVPRERQTVGYHVRRAIIRGVTASKREPLIGFRTLKSLFAVPSYAIALPVLFVARRHIAIRYMVKLCDHVSKLLAHAGIRVIHDRNAMTGHGRPLRDSGTLSDWNRGAGERPHGCQRHIRERGCWRL